MLKASLLCLCLLVPAPGRSEDHAALIERAAIAAHNGQPARARHDLLEALKADPKDPALSRALDQLNHHGRIDLEGPSAALMDAKPATPEQVRSAMDEYGAALKRLAGQGWQHVKDWAAQAKAFWDRHRPGAGAAPAELRAPAKKGPVRPTRRI